MNLLMFSPDGFPPVRAAEISPFSVPRRTAHGEPLSAVFPVVHTLYDYDKRI
jgi:hypothetical protein